MIHIVSFQTKNFRGKYDNGKNGSTFFNVFYKFVKCLLIFHIHSYYTVPSWYPLQLQVLPDGIIKTRLDWLQIKADRVQTQGRICVRLSCYGKKLRGQGGPHQEERCKEEAG